MCIKLYIIYIAPKAMFNHMDGRTALPGLEGYVNIKFRS